MALSEKQLAAAYEAEYPDRDWNQSCQAAVAHAARYTTGKVTFYLRAVDAYEDSQIVSRDPSKATRNDVHFWAIGPDWHTGFELDGGRIFMASRHTDSSFGKNLGVTTEGAYRAATGAVYRGFARGNGVNRIAIAAPRPTTGGSKRIRIVAAYLNAEHLGEQTRAANDGVVDQTGRVVQVYWRLVQKWGRQHGLYGASFKIDGLVKPRGGQTRAVEEIIYRRALAESKR